MRLLQDDDLQEHPRVRAYLANDEPNMELLDEQDLNEGAEFRLHPRSDRLSLIQLCSLFGKKRHIEALRFDVAQYKQAVKARNYCAILIAVENGDLVTIQYLEGYLTPEERKAAVKADNYCAILSAVLNGDLATIQYLESHLTPEERNEAVHQAQCSPIRAATEMGHLATLQYLEGYLTPEEIKEAVQKYYCDAIRTAAQNGHLAIIQHFLDTQKWFISYMEAHDREFGARFNELWVTDQIARLRQARLVFQVAQPNGVFTVSEAEARRYARMIMKLIRRGVAPEYAGAEDGLDDLRFLLSIDGVRALCHLPLSERGQENQLLRLAMRIHNQEAAGILLGILEVRQRAEQHGYYRQEEAQAEAEALALEELNRYLSSCLESRGFFGQPGCGSSETNSGKQCSPKPNN